MAQFLTQSLAAHHHVRLTERVQLEPPPTVNKGEQPTAEGGIEFVCSPLEHDFGSNLLAREMDTVIHVAEPLDTDNEYTQIDILTRCTYNLLVAAVQEGVPHLLLLSTLALMTEYQPSYRISERWRPQPSTDPYVLSKHLAEFTAREFAREQKIHVTVVRLGQLVYPDREPLSVGELPAVDAAVVAQAVDHLLHKPAERWSIYHIGNESTHPHFTMSKARTRGLV